MSHYPKKVVHYPQKFVLRADNAGMASIQETKNGKFQVRIKNKALPKPLFFTFDTRDEAVAYADSATAMLRQGIVPQVLLDLSVEKKAAEVTSPLLASVVRAYVSAAPVTDSDAKLLYVMLHELVGLRVDDVTVKWVEGYVLSLKTGRENLPGALGRKVKNLAPGSIRKRVESLARVLDWHWRRETPAGGAAPPNPLRSMPKGYSTYTAAESKAAEKKGLRAKKDVTRDRRLLPAEEVRVARVLQGELVDGMSAPLAPDAEMLMLFRLILSTGMRLQEAYMLRVDQVDFGRGLISVDGSKGHRGAAKPRSVPMLPALAAQLRAWCDGKRGRLFAFWDGTPDGRPRVSVMLTTRFIKLFERAGVPDFTEHDLRHSACCAWFELRAPDGRWVFSDVEICKIMGWSNYAMILRYASLRGEDLVARLAHLKS